MNNEKRKNKILSINRTSNKLANEANSLEEESNRPGFGSIQGNIQGNNNFKNRATFANHYQSSSSSSNHGSNNHNNSGSKQNNKNDKSEDFDDLLSVIKNGELFNQGGGNGKRGIRQSKITNGF